MSASLVTLPAVLTTDAVGPAQAALRRSMAALPAGAAVVLDARGVQTFDSAGLALLLACRREALAQGRTLQLQGASGSLRDLAQMYGVLPLLDPAAVAA
jgi:phospholipid transport system transporter-binding protein